MSELKSMSPLHNRKNVNGKNSLTALPWGGKINLRGELNTKNFTTQVESVLGLGVPDTAHTCTSNENLTIYWLGPNEWLIYCQLEQTTMLINKLKSVLSEIHSAVVDVTDYYVMFKLEGPNASDLLTKACPMDLFSTVFQKNRCSQTRFGHASILLHKIDDTPTYFIQVRWSFAEYVWDYLLSVMQTLDN